MNACKISLIVEQNPLIESIKKKDVFIVLLNISWEIRDNGFPLALARIVIILPL